RDRRGHLAALQPLAVEQTTDGIGDGGAVDDRPVDDAVGRNGFDAPAGDLPALALRTQLDRLDGAGADVEANDRACPAEAREQSHRATRLCGKVPAEPMGKRDASSSQARNPSIRAELASARKRTGCSF